MTRMMHSWLAGGHAASHKEIYRLDKQIPFVSIKRSTQSDQRLDAFVLHEQTVINRIVAIEGAKNYDHQIGN
jgi:hypothetical protein